MFVVDYTQSTQPSGLLVVQTVAQSFGGNWLDQAS
jgi:hypothetical protein